MSLYTRNHDKKVEEVEVRFYQITASISVEQQAVKVKCDKLWVYGWFERNMDGWGPQETQSQSPPALKRTDIGKCVLASASYIARIVDERHYLSTSMTLERAEDGSDVQAVETCRNHPMELKPGKIYDRVHDDHLHNRVKVFIYLHTCRTALHSLFPLQLSKCSLASPTLIWFADLPSNPITNSAHLIQIHTSGHAKAMQEID